MKVAVIYNKREIKAKDVIDIFGARTKEKYNPKTVDRVATAVENGEDVRSHSEYILRDSPVDRAMLLGMVIRLSAEGKS